MRRNGTRDRLDPDEMMPFLRYRVGDRVKRWMDPFPLSHHGVFVGLPDQPLVIQANKDRGVHFASVEEFAAGRRPQIVNRADGGIDSALRVSRAQSRIGSPYSALRANCEHLATYAQTGKAISWQLRVIVTAVVFVLLAVLWRALAARR